jgi:hypothetical protein
MLSAVNLFEHCPLQTSVISGDWLHFRPFKSISDSGSVTIFVSGQSSHCADMNKTMMRSKFRGLQEDGTVLDGNEPEYAL